MVQSGARLSRHKIESAEKPIPSVHMLAPEFTEKQEFDPVFPERVAIFVTTRLAGLRPVLIASLTLGTVELYG
jgi:hypothetical protein